MTEALPSADFGSRLNEWSPDPAKLRALAEFAAGAGHEINNPLATIIGRAQQLLRDEADPNRRQSLATIAAQAYRIRDMIGDVMLFARPPVPELKDVSLRATVVMVIERLSPQLAEGKCRAQIDSEEDANLTADPAQLAIVVSELLRNAITALQPAGGDIAINVAAEDQIAVLSITDYGRGFADLECEHAFDPFFSGRQAGRGLGFGLCKVWRIVEQHGGVIAIASAPGGPTTVTVRWPRAVSL
jgi:signal transduction histidine kinase